MRKTREQLEGDEDAVLANCAQRVAASRGRGYDEPQHPYRTDYQRDRARIIHSRAFRRLEYKTQVFLNGSGDHLRTRLTHTIEVASVSRTIACALGLNEDLAETIALAHDLGHAPVGHAGEEKLGELMVGHGGFEHNMQSLRVVETIEPRYPDFDGLNLTYEVLEGLHKHEGSLDGGDGGEPYSNPSLEAQVANLADEITYYSHDLDDGLEHDLITERQLEEIEIWCVCRDRVRHDFPHLTGKRLLTYVIRHLIDYEVENLVATTHANLEEAGVSDVSAIRRHPQRLAAYGDDMRKQNAQLRKFLYENLYYHQVVAGPNQRGCELIEKVFAYYLEHPERLGERTSERLERDGLHRTVCDYVSGMTDRYLMEEARALG